MADGIIKDPVNNPTESRFGVLQDLSDGHFKLYLKDDDSSRFFPANTPVYFKKEKAQVLMTGNNHKIDIEIAVNVTLSNDFGPQPMIDQYIKLARVKLGRKHNKYQDWTQEEIDDVKREDTVGPDMPSGKTR